MTDYKEVKKSLDKIQSDYNRDAFEDYAVKKGVRYPKAAAKLANYDGDNLEQALKDVLEAHPYVNAEKVSPKEIGGVTDTGNVPDNLPDMQALQEAYAKAKVGNVKDRVAYATLKRKMGKS